MDQVNGAIKRHLGADRLRIGMVGSEMEQMREALCGGECRMMEHETARAADVLSADEAAPARDPGLHAVRVRVIPVSQIFE